MFVRPFDIHGHAIYLLDIRDEPGEFDQLGVREGLVVAPVLFPLLCTSFWVSHIESSLLPITASFTSSRTLSTVKVSGVTRPATTVSPRPQLALKTASS